MFTMLSHVTTYKTLLFQYFLISKLNQTLNIFTHSVAPSPSLWFTTNFQNWMSICILAFFMPFPLSCYVCPDTIPTRNGRELGEIWVSKVGTNF